MDLSLKDAYCVIDGRVDRQFTFEASIVYEAALYSIVMGKLNGKF
jgi:hypothetical protein